MNAPIGIFDSGYGGLTVMKEIVRVLPQYDYIYLGDNARAPYGPRSFETVHKYTLQAVEWFFSKGCHLVVLACNTASSKALRTIQQSDLPVIAPEKRVLGVIRPVTERVNEYTATNHIGVLGTTGTIASESYSIEITKFFPNITVVQEACPMWVPLVENGEHDSPGTDYFVKKHLDHILHVDSNIDALILGCTHYPLLLNKIKKYLPVGISVVSQADIVAQSLCDYLNRHPEHEIKCSKGGERYFYTTDSADIFNKHASVFLGSDIESRRIQIQ
jgi:glutamate racemase